MESGENEARPASTGPPNPIAVYDWQRPWVQTKLMHELAEHHSFGLVAWNMVHRFLFCRHHCRASSREAFSNSLGPAAFIRGDLGQVSFAAARTRDASPFSISRIRYGKAATPPLNILSLKNSWRLGALGLSLNAAFYWG